MLSPAFLAHWGLLGLEFETPSLREKQSYIDLQAKDCFELKQDLKESALLLGENGA